MKFNISKLVLWLKNGSTREINFLPNKVNVITGRSNTGKTTIIDIIDYCLFSSRSKIPESIINENTLWYGLVININDKKITISRRAPEKSMVSNEYYLSSIGEVPALLTCNINESSLKKLLESEFSIDSNARFEYGGKYIRTGSKISLRYFQLFNTISGNIIENDSGIFFDKQNEDSYREALTRIFDLAVGIDSIENILKKDKLEQLKKELSRLERRKLKLEGKSNDFLNERKELIRKARQFSVINSDLSDDESWAEIKNIDIESVLKPDVNNKREAIEQKYFKEFNKIKKLKSFENEYALYKKSLSQINDTLKPIEYLRNNDSGLIKTSIFDEITLELENQIVKIKKEIKNKTPINIQVSDEIKKSEEKLKEIEDELKSYPNDVLSFDSLKDKYFFLGQLLTKVNIFDDVKSIDESQINTKEIERQIESINIVDTTERKELTIKAIEEIISDYINEVGSALENYQGYQPVFDYKNKSLTLRKKKSTFTENVGSSSNQMFLHLFFMLAIHELIRENKSSFVAPYLIIDQPSRPYYGDESDSEKMIESSDEAKIKKAFSLLDSFVNESINSNCDFQIIVLEHIPVQLLKDFDNVHIVEEFRNGNALINI
ncbi:DUF3732 domain-containing protein [Photobacterium leiognathi]|uniref:DUF3732 domain-containing protein n=1 Tax=Photobacterium leiognathi TaxID=553611 RepID=UPI002981DBB5|nr:DUF3732 domain-containing protein [Photobacterium leiognathi]